MKETKRRFFYFSAADFKGVQKLLEEEAANGWELEEVDGFFTARFVRTERTDQTYYVDLMPVGVHPDTKRKYRELCEDAGWELTGGCSSAKGSGETWYHSGFWIFKSKPGQDPVPVQTDAEIEKGNFKEYVLKAMLGSILMVFYFGFHWMRSLTDGTGWYGSWGNFATCAIGLLLSAYLGLRMVDLLATAVWYHRAVRKEGMLPATPKLVMYGRGASLLLIMPAFPLAMFGILMSSLSAESGMLGYVILGVAALLSLLGGTIGVARWGGTKRQKKALRLLGAACVVCLILLGLLDRKGPWKYASGGGTVETVQNWRQAEIAGQPVVTLDDVGIEYTRAKCTYQNGTAPVGSWWIYKESCTGWWENPGEDGSVNSFYYRCINETLAGWMAKDLQRAVNEAAENEIFTEWKLDGFDECWYGSDPAEDSSSSAILFRRGNQVAVVIADVDLLDESNLSAVLWALGME